MNVIDASEKFLTRKIYQMDAETLYAIFSELTKDNHEGICDKSIPYLKAFVQYPPSECIQAIRKKEGTHLSLSIWGEEYLHHLTTIAAYHLDRKQIDTGILWAVKAINMADYFAPTLSSAERLKFCRGMFASTMVRCYLQHYNKRAIDNFFLKWEVERFCYCGYRVFFNDN